MPIKNKNISFQANALLDNLIGEKKVCFEIDTAYRILAYSSQDAVKKLLSDMTKRGLLMRVKEGLYYIIPFEQDAKMFMPDWHLLAQYLVGEGLTVERLLLDAYTPKSRNKLINMMFKEIGLVENMVRAYGVLSRYVKNMVVVPLIFITNSMVLRSLF